MKGHDRIKRKVRNGRPVHANSEDSLPSRVTKYLVKNGYGWDGEGNKWVPNAPLGETQQVLTKGRR